MSIYRSTLNNSKPEKEKKKKEKPEKIKVRQSPIIGVDKYVKLVLAVISAVAFVMLCCPSNFVKNLLLGLVGISAYPICLLCVFVCAMGLSKNKYEINRKYVVYLSCALFFVLMILHLVLTTNLKLDGYGEYLKSTYQLKTSGAGLVMSLFTYPMKKYLTTVGAYILSVILVTVFVGLIIDARQPKQKKEEAKQIEKSKFDFGGMISETKPEEVPITVQHKQEDLKKQIAKQKLGLEKGASTIISSSMRVEDIEDTPKKYKSKRDYILTPPEIVLPDYDSQPKAEPSAPIRQERTEASDIFVTDASEFYKDAKVIEARERTDEDKIQEIKPTPFGSNERPIGARSAEKIADNQEYFAQQKPQDITRNAEIKPSMAQEQFRTPSSDEFGQIRPQFNSSYLQDEAKQTDAAEREPYSTEVSEDEPSLINNAIHDNLDEWLDEDKIEEEVSPIVEPPKPAQTEIELPSSNTSTVIHSNTFTAQNNKVFTREIVEEKKEDENALGRPKKYHPEYIKPPTDLLEYIENVDVVTDEECAENIESLERVLQDFKINAKVKAVQVGPAVTRYEIGMPQGVSVKKVQFHADDIAMALASNGSIRIEAPIPGKNAVGIEVPNRNVTAVSLREMVESLDFQKRINPMSFVLGKDINGSIQFCNLDKMPHLLVAGSTGSGKSVCLNTMLISMLYKSSPEDVRLILIDPKTVEFSTYANLPHLLTPEIITTKEQTINALNWAIKEMEYRYTLLQRNQVVNIKEYNSLDIVKNGEVEKLPYIVIVIDELGDLMIDAKRDMEERIMKLAQKSRAAGIHLVIATQRPSVDVITGTIKANLPSRIAFALTNFADSKTVLDMAGAEKLLGKGDMLFKPSDLPEPRRVQGAYISSKEVASVVKFIKENNKADYDEGAMKDINQTAEVQGQNLEGNAVSFDPVLRDALRFFIQANQASITMIQRRFGVGYARAARIIDQMEQNGFISTPDGSKPRQVLISLEEFNLLFNQ